jgi:hypothetical protein
MLISGGLLMKLNRLRIFQASGLGIIIMFPLGYLISILFPVLNLQLDPNVALILLTLPVIMIGQIVIGYWIGRHVDTQLFLHVFLANMLIVILNYIINYVFYGFLNNSPGSAIIVTVILAWPTAIFVRKKRLSSSRFR